MFVCYDEEPKLENRLRAKQMVFIYLSRRTIASSTAKTRLLPDLLGLYSRYAEYVVRRGRSDRPHVK